VRKRLEVYEKQTRPLVDYYSKWAALGDPRAPRYRKIPGKGSSRTSAPAPSPH